MLDVLWWWVLLLLPLPFIIRHKPVQASHQTALKLAGAGRGLRQGKRPLTRLARPGLWLVWMLLVLACARPQWVGEPIPIAQEGRELMLALDLSGSMEIPDMKLNGDTVDRFTMVQHLSAEFVSRRQGDRLGLILFGDRAYLQAPLTQDSRSIVQYLEEAQLGLVGNQTAIGDAIALAAKRFDQRSDSNKVLVLLTDGSNTAGSLSPQQALELAKAVGVVIYAIGVGADEMEQRSLFGSFKVPTASDLDEGALKAMANATNGEYFRARSSQDMQRIYQAIEQLQPIEAEGNQYRPRTELFYLPLLLALLVCAIQLLSPWVPNWRPARGDA
ncbi:vWA domain-containing protein [Paraferrimonas sedimenticola]|uniref:VWR domain protein in aerotolerance operon BatA n=1 Tax=Paraferrimonas sedimenticola TaxID=375674 RepID=A0AA37RXA3_9GAMM|nr:VWA domain-containing protein [Paraferrimonas sedimenticola]GLP96599.1 VWR domain protein in aerotolerance operon BatA [Paraferrimonas sedimenticola]